MNDIVHSYKGFDKDLKCRGFQYEVGGEYETNWAVVCDTGFHACTVPLDVFSHYAPGTSRYCEVEQSGTISKETKGSKVASTKIKVGAEIGVPGLVKAQVEWVKEICKNSPEHMNDADKGHAVSQGNWGHAVSQGNLGHAVSQGNRGHAVSQGQEGHAAAQGEDGHAAAQGNWGHAAAQGNWGHAAAQGYKGHAEVKGNHSIAAAFGVEGKVKACQGGWIVAAEWKDTATGFELIGVLSAKVDGDTIKADTWYMVKDGKFVETDDSY